MIPFMLTKKRKNSETGTLQRTTAPANSKISTAYLNNGLAAICNKDKGISFYVGWTCGEQGQHVADTIPEVF